MVKNFLQFVGVCGSDEGGARGPVNLEDAELHPSRGRGPKNGLGGGVGGKLLRWFHNPPEFASVRVRVFDKKCEKREFRLA
jgi:hypothetical protein